MKEREDDRVFECPICLDVTSVMHPDFLKITKKRWSLYGLKLHIFNVHNLAQLIEFVADEAENPDNGYYDHLNEIKMAAHPPGCECDAHQDHSWIK